MKKTNKRRLNNKGFTLIELLAVVVILAVVMGIATTSVLGAANNSRKTTLLDSAKSAATAFQDKYSAAMLSGATGTVLATTNPQFGGYKFTVPATTANPYHYQINESSSAELNLSKNEYSLADEAQAIQNGTPYSDSAVSISDSFVVFDGDRIVVCLIVPETSKYYVGQATKDTSTSITVLKQEFSISADTMFACSDEQTSWS